MPAVVGDIKIQILATSSVFELGDAFQLSPESYIEAYGGRNSFAYRPKKAVITESVKTIFYWGEYAENHLT